MKKRNKFLAAISLTLAAALTFGAVGCNKQDGQPNDGHVGSGSVTVQAPITDVPQGAFAPEETDTTVKVDGASASAITGGYEKGSSRATQSAEYLGLVDQIVKPVAEVTDERATYGVKEYPKYGSNLQGYTQDERDGIYWESISLIPEPTWRSQGIYNGIDSEGYLLKNGERIEDGNGGYRLLYAHTASTSMYGGGLSDNEPRIVKKITALTHTKLASTQITGLYAPAGEVIKIEMPESEYKAAGGIAVYIGQNYNLDQQVAMEFSGSGVKGSGLSRMTDILSKFELRDKYKNVTIENGIATAYVGSFLGGPIYFRPLSNNEERRISVTISGAVKYQHFILGVTTPEEYEFNKNTTAPYFDLEVYESVRFTTHKFAASGGLALKDYTYENCTDAAILWDKIAEVSTRVGPNGLSGASAPIYIIGDCYIAAGAAFANPGRNGVVCPPSWLAEALNYKNFINGGSWGTMHEYNHCWQGYGVANNGEVTNNATTLVSYSLYTRISAGRTAAVNWGDGGWNRFTDPAKALGELLNQSKSGNKCFDLPLYATLIHNIGQDNFVTAATGGNYYDKLVNATHYDMSYYFTNIMNFDVGESYAASGTVANSQIQSAKEKNYPMFVPVASVYQVGRSILRDGVSQDIITAQPFSYGSGEFTMNFNNQNNFKNNNWASKALVIPDGFTVTVKSVTQPENGKVELLANNQVKYTPDSGENGLYSGNFRVKLSITKDDKAFNVDDVDLIINLKQSASTTLNRTTYVYGDAASVPATDSVYNVTAKTFNFGNYSSTETKKNVCTQETNTQIWAAGRNYDDNTYNKDSKNYRVMPNNQTLQTMEGVMYFSGAGTYRFTLKGRGKATLYLSYDDGATWESALTINRTSGNEYINGEYSEHAFTTGNNYVQFKVVLLVTQESDFFGVGVAKRNADGTYPAFANASNAITIDTAGVDKAVKADSANKFETDYRYKNEYTYSYSSENKVWASGTTLVSVSHESWDDTTLIKNMFDGNANTYYHSKGSNDGSTYITEEKPFELIVDFGSVRKVNSVTFNGFSGKIGNNGMVKTFKIYGSVDGENYSLVKEVTDSAADAKTMTFGFDPVEIKYYKLVVTKTDNGRYFAMNSIVFSYSIAFSKGNIVAPTADGVKFTGTWDTKNELCNYGIIYTAGKDDSVEYTFSGSRFAYFAAQSEDYGTVDIYVDGKLVAENVDLSGKGNAGGGALYDRYNYKYAADSVAYMYTGDALAEGEHTVKVVGKSGKFNVESFAYWN